MSQLFSLTALTLAALAGTPDAPLTLVDDLGAPVAAASVDFTDSRGAHDRETTDSAGTASVPGSFIPVAADVTKAGFASRHLVLGKLGSPRVALGRSLPVIGSETVATGSRKNAHEAPLATSTLDAATISLTPATTTDRLLRQLPGFDRSRSSSAFTNYGLLRASFSGAGTDRGVVLVDGFPAQDGFGGQIDWQAYPTDVIERAELLRGAGSGLYGSGAVGGALAITTFGPRTGAGMVPDGSILLGAGSNQQADNAVLARTTLGSTLGASVSTVATQLAYADLPPAYSSPIDHPAHSSSGANDVRLRFDDGKSTLDGAFLASSDQQDEGRPNYTFERNLRQENVAASERIGSAVTRFAYYNRDTTVYNNSDMFPPAATAGMLRYRQHVPTNENGFFASLGANPGTTELELLVDQRRVDGRSEQYGPKGTLQALGTGVQLGQGVGVQATFHAPRAELLLGARADRVRYDDLAYTTSAIGVVTPHAVAGHDVGAISPRAALRYDLTQRVALRLSSGGGFRAPYLNELVRGFNVGQTVMSPNPELVPERSRTDTAGVDVLLGSGRLAFDVTQTRVSDAIAFRTVTGAAPPRMVRANLDKTQTNGETLTFAQPIGTCTRLRISGTTQNPRVTAGPANDFGKALTLVPLRTATVGVDAGRGAFAYSIDGSYIGQTYYDDLNTEPLGAALLFGATVRATTPSGVTFTVAGDNLTRQTYLANIDRYGQPLTVTLRIGIPFGARARAAAAPSCTLTQTSG